MKIKKIKSEETLKKLKKLNFKNSQDTHGSVDMHFTHFIENPTYYLVSRDQLKICVVSAKTGDITFMVEGTGGYELIGDEGFISTTTRLLAREDILEL